MEESAPRERHPKNAAAAHYFPVTCAWCFADGRVRILRYTSRADSHGICPDHIQELLAEWHDSKSGEKLEVSSGG